MGLGTWTLLGLLMAPGQAPPDIMHFSQSKMEIPIRYDPKLKNAIQHLILFGSSDEGRTWKQYETADPSKDKFLFTSPGDGVYWLSMVVVDTKGGRDPQDLSKAEPGLKVHIDTKAPAIQIKSVERINDEVQVAWTVDELNPDWSRFRVEYRSGENYWTVAEAKGATVGSARFRTTENGPISVRITAFDLAGNRAESVKDLATAPNVLPTRETGSGIQAARFQPPADLNVPSLGGSGVPAAPTGMGTPSTPPAETEFKTIDPRGTTLPGSSGIVTPMEQPIPLQPATPPARNEIPTGGAPAYTTNLPTAQVINVSRFDVAYAVENKGPSGVSRAEIWVTRDDGKSWQKWDTSEKGESPITVDLAKRGNAQVEGVYGIKIVLLSGAGLSKGPPVSGDAPDMRVDVDLMPPTVKIYEPVPDPNQRDTMILRWQATDRNLTAEPITLEWAETVDGPWVPIVAADGGGNAALSSAGGSAKRLPNTGQYAWKLPQNFPTHKVFLRVTARDTAGNVAEHKTLHPVLVDLNKPEAKIQGIIGASSEKR